MADTEDPDVELDLMSFSVLQRAPDRVRPPDIPAAPPIAAPVPPAPQAPTPPPAPTAVDAGPIRSKRLYRTVASVPEISEETLARSPKLQKWRDRERNRINARAYRARQREARQRLKDQKQRVCRACLKLFLPTEKRRTAAYHSDKCQQAWMRVRHCFDGEAAWLYRVAQARATLVNDEASSESVKAAQYLLDHAPPDYSPYPTRPGTLMSALAKGFEKLRARWAPHTAEAIRLGKAEVNLRPDMLKELSPYLSGRSEQE